MRLYYALLIFFLTSTIYGQINIPTKYRLPACFLRLVKNSSLSMFGDSLADYRVGTLEK